MSDRRYFKRLHGPDGEGGEISLVSVIDIYPDMILTAVRDGDGKLRLIAWKVDSNGGITRSSGPDGEGGEISLVSVIDIQADMILTAVRDGDGKLRLIAWKVDSNGGITRSSGPDGEGGEITLLSILPLFHGSYTITAVRDGDGKLRLNLWHLDSRTGSIKQYSDPDACTEQINLISLVHFFSESLVVTAVRDGDGKLRLIAWRTIDLSGPRS